VDASDRWQDEPTDENDIAAAHRFVERYVAALEGATVISAADEAVTDLVTGAGDIDAVFWAAGEDATTHHSIDAGQQAWLQGLVDGGVSLFVSGAEVGWDLTTGAELAFYNQTLHATYVEDDSEVYVVSPSPGGLFDGIGDTGLWTPGVLFVAWPDVISPGAGASQVLTYASGGGAAVAHPGPPGIVVFGFPFEAIDLASTRTSVMQVVLSFFSL
jgi:hypothetical protein